MIWMLALSAAGKIAEGHQKKAAYDIKSIQSKTEAKYSQLEAQKMSTSILAGFNNRMASDVVVGASQSRRGGSVEGIRSAAQTELDWDMSFAKASGDLNYMNRMAESRSYSAAGDQAMINSVRDGAMSMFSGYAKAKGVSSMSGFGREVKKDYNKYFTKKS